MSRKGFLLYAAVLSGLSVVAVALVSAWLAVEGYVLPWVTRSAHSIAISNAWVLLPGIVVGLATAGLSHYLALRTHNRMYYYAGPIVIFVIVAVVILFLYGGACGFCARVVCPGHVQSCGIKLKLSISFVKIYCTCYNGWQPQLPHGVSQALTWLRNGARFVIA